MTDVPAPAFLLLPRRPPQLRKRGYVPLPIYAENHPANPVRRLIHAETPLEKLKASSLWNRERVEPVRCASSDSCAKRAGQSFFGTPEHLRAGRSIRVSAVVIFM